MSIASGLARLIGPLASIGRRNSDRRLHPEALVRVGFDDREVLCSYPEGSFRTVAWSEITEVRVRTTSDGPFAPDVFWEVHAGGEAPRMVFPGGATGEGELLEAMQRRLEGFDNGAFIRAMGCADDALFVVWKAPSAVVGA